MKKTISIIRSAALCLASVIALILLLGEENDPVFSDWLLHFLIDKTIAAAIIALIYRALKRRKPSFD